MGYEPFFLGGEVDDTWCQQLRTLIIFSSNPWENLAFILEDMHDLLFCLAIFNVYIILPIVLELTSLFYQ